MPQPPIITLDEADIAAYGVCSLTELLAALTPQTGSGRGRGGGRPVILFNGQRISNFREFRNFPPEAIRRVEVLPEEVALRFGFPPNQRVVNFILQRQFRRAAVDLEYRNARARRQLGREFDASMLRIQRAGRLNLNVRDRGYLDADRSRARLAPDPRFEPRRDHATRSAAFRTLIQLATMANLPAAGQPGWARAGRAAR